MANPRRGRPGRGRGNAVLTGALLIGDSVRGSLRHLVLDRLGKIDQLLVVDRSFAKSWRRRWLATAMSRRGSPKSRQPFCFRRNGAKRRAARQAAGFGVLVVAARRRSGPDGTNRRPKKAPGAGEILINAPWPRSWRQNRDTLVVRFGKADQSAADSPLGRRSDRIASLAS